MSKFLQCIGIAITIFVDVIVCQYVMLDDNLDEMRNDALNLFWSALIKDHSPKMFDSFVDIMEKKAKDPGADFKSIFKEDDFVTFLIANMKKVLEKGRQTSKAAQHKLLKKLNGIKKDVPKIDSSKIQPPDTTWDDVELYDFILEGMEGE